MKHNQYTSIPNLSSDIEVNGIVVYGRPVSNTKPIDILFGLSVISIVAVLVILLAYFYGPVLLKEVSNVVSDINAALDLNGAIRDLSKIKP